MSNAGRGKPNRIPGIPGNGNADMEIPPDLVWDEDNPPIIFPCSQHTEHHPMCPGNDPSITLDSELQVELLNEARAWARIGMNFRGVPTSLAHLTPGIQVELVDIMCWFEVMRDIVIEMSDIELFEFEEKFRERKLLTLRTIREQNEANIKKQRLVNQFGIVEKKVLGPDGRPIG